MPNLLVVVDDRTTLHMFRCAFQGTDVELVAAQSAVQGRDAFDRHRPDAVVLDVTTSDRSGMELFAQLREVDACVPVIFVTALATADTAIDAMRLGAFDYLVKPLDLTQIRDLLARAFETRRLTKIPVRMTPGIDDAEMSQDLLVGNCAAMQEVCKAIGRVAPQAVNVLIRGESGTGKELVARAIYQHGPRADKQFLTIHCAVVPQPLLESELFGHERGAFAGAESRRIGKLEQAHGATLFLDEVGDMTPLMQSKVLRTLDERRFERIGGTQTLSADAVILAATSRDLEHRVAEGRFRADLYRRLSLCTIRLPPLRDRGADIPLLAEYYLHRFNRELGKTVTDISTDALELLLRYVWPGNVRELQSAIKQAMLHATSDILLPSFFPSRLRASLRELPEEPRAAKVSYAPLESLIDRELAAGGRDLYAKSLAFMERTLLARVLRYTGGNQSRAANLLGITRGSLRNKIRLLHITINPAVCVEEEPSGADA